MTLRDGRYFCDRDGTELENGGVHECVIASDLVDGRAVVYHFCRVNGCAGKVLSTRNLKDYRERV